MEDNALSKELKWLHISDFHCKENVKWSQDIVLNSMLNDIQQKYSVVTKPDLIFVTGDISFSGKKAEFDIAQEFIDKLSEVTLVGKDKIFFVPGNHDIDRGEEEDAIVGARILISSLPELDRIYSNPKRLKTLYNRQKNYRNFVNDNHPEKIYLEDSSAHNIEIELKSIKIKILLLDSAWLSHDDTDCKKLAVGLQQIPNCVDDSHKNYLVIALMHHPVSWLKEFEELLIENALIKCAHIVLRGHVHQGDTSSIEKNSERLVIFTAGATYESRTSVNSYSFGKLNLLTGKGKKYSHSYSGTTNSWNISGTDLWKLELSPVLSFEEIYSLVSFQATKFPSYISCLINTFKTDVPIKYKGRYIFISKLATIDSDSEEIIDSIDQLQWLVCFQYSWEKSDWTEQFNGIVLKLENALASIDEMSAELKRVEQESKMLLSKFLNTSSDMIDSINDSIICFISTGEFDNAYDLIEKWENGLDLKDGESRYLKMKKLEVLLAENSSEKIQLYINEFQNIGDLTEEELILLSSAYYKVKMFPDAETTIIKLLDMGTDIVLVRRLARAIAGKTGNKHLVERVN